MQSFSGSERCLRKTDMVPETVCIGSHRTKESMTQMFCDASKTSFGFSTVFGVLVA